VMRPEHRPVRLRFVGKRPEHKTGTTERNK
jgi:hypothetical protein